METTSEASSNVSGQIFLDPLNTNVNLSKEAVSLPAESSVAMQSTFHVDQSAGSQAMALVQITDGVTPEGQVQQIYQLVPQSYGTEQQTFVATQPVENKDASTSGTVNLTQLGTTLPLTMANGAMTVLESNGQHFIVLPNFPNVSGENNNQLVIGESIVSQNMSLPQVSEGIALSGIEQVQTSTVNQAVTTSTDQPLIQNPPIVTSQTKITTKISHAQSRTVNMLRFHNLSSDGTRMETSTTKSQLKMLDIIPSFFQRTVHQQTEVTNTCKFCKFKAKTLQEMEKHLEEHKKDDALRKKMTLWKPKKPPKKKKAQMIRTTSSKTGSYPPKCPSCEETLKSYTQYKKHIKLHEGEKPHRCTECKESFNKEHNLNLHKSLHQKIDLSSREDKYQCPACERSFSRLAGLKMHISLHAEEENFICKECGDEFPTDESLTTHVAEHNIDLARHLHNRQNVGPDTLGDAVQKSIVVAFSATSEFLHQPSLKTPDDTNRKGRGSLTSKVPGAHNCDQCGKYFQKKSQLIRHRLIHTGERPHKCDDCGKAFNQKSALRQHLSLHSGEKKFSCPHCPQSYRQRGNLNLHIKRVHALAESGGNNFACQYCCCVFRKLGSLNSHVTKYHKQLSLTESQMISVDDKTRAEQQSQDQDLQNILYAVYDDSQPSNNVNSQTNQASNSDIVNQAISDCVKGTETNKNMPSLLEELNNPSSTVSSEALLAEFEQTLPMPTEQVDQSSDLISLLSNRATPGGTGDYNVSTQVQGMTTITTAPIVETADFQIVGGWGFDAGLNKTKNWRTKLRNGLRYHECLFCNKEFRKPSDLQRHIRVHTLERPFKCKQCSKDFTVKSSLNAHIRSHLGLKPYRCLVCHKSFTTAGTLRIHSRIHTGAKPFPCPHCDKKFRTSGQRANHVCLHFRSNTPQPRAKIPKKKSPVEYPDIKLLPPMISTSTGTFKLTKSALEGPDSMGKPYTCDQCQKQFKRLKTLQLHMKLHTGDKPYKCDRCDKSFVAMMYLKAHIKVHEGLDKFVCGVCGHKFSTKGSLKRHATKHSNERPYFCPYCKKTFKTYDSCSKHIKGHRKDVLTIMNPSSQAAVVNTQISQVPTVSNAGTLPEVNPVEEDLRNTFIQNLSTADDNTEPSAMKQVNPNVVQNVMNLASMDAQSPQTLTQALMDTPQNTANEPMLNQQPQVNTSSLEYLTNLSVPETPNLLLNQVQSQDAMQFFEFNLTNQVDAANASRPLYVDQLDLITNMAPTPTATVAPTATMAVLAAPQAKSNERTSKRRGKYHGGKELRYGDQLMYQCMGCETIFISEEFIDHAKKFSSKRHELTFLCEFCCHRFAQPTHHQSHLEFHKVDSGIVVYKCEKCGVGFADNAIRDDHRDNFCSLMESTSISRKKKLNAPSMKHNVPSTTKPRASFIRFTEDQNRILAQTNPNLHMTMSERVLLSAVAEKDRVIEAVTKKRGRFKALETDGPKHKYACHQCPKSFYKNCDLVRHIRTHTGEKPFKCKTCGKSFSVKSCLVSHEKIHTGVKEFRCHICDLMYSSKASLKVHMRLHTGGLPFKCPHCDERFRTSGHRKCHIATHFSNKSRRNSKKAQQTSTSPQQEQNNVIVSDLTLMLPEGVLQGNEPLQLQWNGQHFQVMSGTNKFGEHISLQIDPASLQQAINNPAASTSQDIRSYTRPTDTSPAPNLVIQPITLPDSVMRDQGEVQEVNVAVPANLAPFTQMFFQSPNANSNQESTSQPQITEDPKVAKSALEQKEVALVLTPEELATQALVPENSMQQFTLDLLNSEAIQPEGNEPFT